MEKQSLVKALTNRSLSIGAEQVVSYLSIEQSLDIRDVFVKAIYDRLFLHIVEKINEAMNGYFTFQLIEFILTLFYLAVFS